MMKIGFSVLMFLLIVSCTATKQSHIQRALDELAASEFSGIKAAPINRNDSSDRTDTAWVSGDQSAVELRSGQWLTTASIVNLLNGNTAYMTFLPAGNTTIVYFSPDGKAIAKNPDSQPFYVANWKVTRNQWCMETNGPTLCYRLRLEGDSVEGWHLEDNRRVRSVVFNAVVGDTANLVNTRKKQLQQQSDEQVRFTAAARTAGFLLFGAALISTIMGDVGDPECNPYCPGQERYVDPKTGNWDAP